MAAKKSKKADARRAQAGARGARDQEDLRSQAPSEPRGSAASVAAATAQGKASNTVRERPATPRRLPRTHTAYRIGDGKGRFPVYSGEGARSAAGRWNAPGQPVIYASEHYSTAMLEKLVRLGEMPPNQHFVTITIPKGTTYEVVTDAVLPTWWEKNALAARTFGAQWYRECRSAVLFVPSVVARMERNVLIHPEHPDTASIEVSLEEPIWWDGRLFGRE